MAEANAKVFGALYRSATRDRSVAAQIFWVKTRMRWREAEAPPDAGPGTEGRPRHVIILPDNGRHGKPMDEYESRKEIFNKTIGGGDANNQKKGLMPLSKDLDSYRAQLLSTSAWSSILRSTNLKSSANFYADHHPMTQFLFPRRTSYPDRVTR